MSQKIDFEKEVFILTDYKGHFRASKVIAWGKSIAARVEKQAIERTFKMLGGYNIKRALKLIPRLYAEKEK